MYFSPCRENGRISHFAAIRQASRRVSHPIIMLKLPLDTCVFVLVVDFKVVGFF